MLNELSKPSSSITEEEISFFKKMDEALSSDEDDAVHHKVSSLLTKIKNKRSENRKELNQFQSVSGFSNERLLFVNQSLSKKSGN